jgi:site-specific DNA recombinase
MPHLEAAFYARVSGEQQADAQTIQSQIAALRERIASDEVLVPPDREFIDDGYSGATLVRPALERLRDFSAAGAIQRIYVHSPDRLARSYAYQVVLLDEWRRYGIEVVFLNKAIGQSPEDDLLLQVQGVVAEYERAKIMERCRRGKRHAARSGNIGVMSCAPYGYRYINSQEGGVARFEPILEQARVVRQIFTWVGRDRLSLNQVARRLRQAGEPTATGKQWWSRTIVWHILQNPAYKGHAAYGKTRTVNRRQRLRPLRGRPIHPRHDHSSAAVDQHDWISIPVPALVDESLFDAAQEQLRENRTRAREGRRQPGCLLQGLTCCSSCGYAYYAKRLRQRGAGRQLVDYVYYRCSGTDGYRFSGGRVCTNTQVRGDLLESAVWAEVRALLETPKRLEDEHRRRLAAPEIDPDLDSIKAQIVKVKQTISRLIDGYAEGLLDKDEFTLRVRRSKERLGRLEEQLQSQADLAAQRRELLLIITRLEDFTARIKDGLQHADWHAKRDLVRALVRRVEIGPDGVNVVFRVDPAIPPSVPPGGIMQDCTRGELTAEGHIRTNKHAISAGHGQPHRAVVTVA